MRVAVIGSGAAAVGALRALYRWRPDARISLFDVGSNPEGPLSTSRPPREWDAGYYGRLYDRIRVDHGFRFPPPKTHFGENLPRYEVGGRPRVFRSELFGGLTNYWGGTMLPFTAAELAGWPVGPDGLRPYYEEMAAVAGVSGRRDGLNRYFPEDFANRPPLCPTPVLARLDEAVNRSAPSGAYTVISGLNRVALETRPDHARSCIYCGECMTGCFAGAVYSARQTVEKDLQAGRVENYVRSRVLAVRPAGGEVAVVTADGPQGGFARVFLCAGCAGTTEIVMRSLGLRDGLTMVDNAVWVFPIFFIGGCSSKAGHEPYLALSNLICGCVPRSPGRYFAQAQVYPSFDYLWRYYVPARYWPWFDGLASLLRARVFWVRLYLHSAHSPAYAMRLDGDEGLVIEPERPAEKSGTITEVMASLRRAINREGFYVPPLRPMLQKTSAHYAATLPYGGGAVAVRSTGEVMPGTYVCDSACFPDSPAVSPTFTIMANSCRVAHEALND